MSPSPSSLVTRTNQHSSVKFTGNFTPKQQARVLGVTDAILRGRGDFARQIASRLELTDVSAYERSEDGKMHAEVVFETDLDEDMLNVGGNLHGGCTMFMIDVCSSVALLVLGIARDTRVNLVSQAITTVFHAPASVGARLRIVNKTTSFGARTVSARTEIWDTTNRRLVATGIHNQMAPSEPKLPTLVPDSPLGPLSAEMDASSGHALEFNYDILVEVVSHARRKNIVSMMLSCRMLYKRGARFLLRDPVRIRDEAHLIQFLSFLQAADYARCEHLYDLFLSHNVYDPSPECCDALLDVLPRLTGLKKLVWDNTQGVLESHPNLAESFAAVSSLTHLGLNYVYEESLWFLRNLKSPLTSFSVDWLGLNSDLGNPSDLVDDLALQTYHPVVVLKNFSETLEWLHCTCWFLSDLATQTFSLERRHEHVYPRMRKLILDHCDYPTVMPFIRGFPNLAHLRVCGGGDSVFEGNQQFGEQLQAFRGGNIRAQLESGTTWQRLEKFSGKLLDLYLLGLTCPIPRVVIKYTWLGAPHVEMLRDVLACARPVHLRMQVEGCFLTEPDGGLAATFRGEGASRLECLALRIALVEETCGLGARLEQLALSMRHLPLRRLRLLVRLDTDVVSADPAEAGPPPPPWKDVMIHVLDMFDLPAFATGLSTGIPTLKDAVIGLCYPSRMDEMGKRIVRIVEGRVHVCEDPKRSCAEFERLW